MRADDTVSSRAAEKRCTACGETKSLSDFYRFRRPDRGPGLYLRSRCKPCFRGPRPTYPTVECAVCERSFKAKPAEIAAGNAKYCSRTCFHVALRQPIDPIVLSEDGLTGRIPLHARDGSIRAYAVIDAADSEWAGQWNWSLNSSGYASRKEWDDEHHCHEVKLHREILGLESGDSLDGDHIDRDRLNCRRSNLRALPIGKNAQNRSSHAGSTSVYRGVSFDKGTGKWIAYFMVEGKRTYLGSFEIETEAAQAARDARRQFMPYAVD